MNESSATNSSTQTTTGVTNKFNYEELRASYEKMQKITGNTESEGSIAWILHNINKTYHELVHVEDKALYGTAAEKLLTDWEYTSSSFDSFVANFQNWATVVANSAGTYDEFERKIQNSNKDFKKNIVSAASIGVGLGTISTGNDAQINNITYSFNQRLKDGTNLYNGSDGYVYYIDENGNHQHVTNSTGKNVSPLSLRKEKEINIGEKKVSIQSEDKTNDLYYGKEFEYEDTTITYVGTESNGKPVYYTIDSDGNRNLLVLNKNGEIDSAPITTSSGDLATLDDFLNGEEIFIGDEQQDIFVLTRAPERDLID